METLKPKIWEKILKEEDWEKRFNLLMNQENYEQTTNTTNTKGAGKTK